MLYNSCNDQKGGILVENSNKKGLKITLTIFFALIAAVVTANIITEIFKSEFKTYYSVDQ